MPTTAIIEPVLSWYDRNARELPWRSPEATPWAILVSEIMLQQTPVSRVLPAYQAWLERWPTPAALATEPAGEAVRQWGRLGYPRRALRLHAAAARIAERHDGRVPMSYAALRELPGVGAYTAAAVATFAFGGRHAVLDTNVRRVLARVFHGEQYPPRSATHREALLANSLLPDDASRAARWGVAVMELGALVCTAREPECAVCPIADACAWRRSGHPQGGVARPVAQRYAGTDRQVRGRLLAILREANEPVPAQHLVTAWHDPVQRGRALDALITDGLVERVDDDHYTLPR